jgi:quinoprotein glucose dehydrogenase
MLPGLSSTGDLKTANDPGEITDEVTPIKIRDTLYLCTPHQKLFALDAATGKAKVEVRSSVEI